MLHGCILKSLEFPKFSRQRFSVFPQLFGIFHGIAVIGSLPHMGSVGSKRPALKARRGACKAGSAPF